MTILSVDSIAAVLIVLLSGLVATAVARQLTGGAVDSGVALAMSAMALLATGFLATYTPEPNAPKNEQEIPTDPTFSCWAAVPCGRTAPSLTSILTGAWPQTHGIRDNFTANTGIADELRSRLQRWLSEQMEQP